VSGAISLLVLACDLSLSVWRFTAIRVKKLFCGLCLHFTNHTASCYSGVFPQTVIDNIDTTVTDNRMRLIQESEIRSKRISLLSLNPKVVYSGLPEGEA
jgi:hypothetical protein